MDLTSFVSAFDNSFGYTRMVRNDRKDILLEVMTNDELMKGEAKEWVLPFAKECEAGATVKTKGNE